MDEMIRIRDLEKGEMPKAHRLVDTVFDEFVAPLFSEEGISQFKSFIDPANLEKRLEDNSFILVAEIHDEVVGVIGMRDWNHIFLLFVDGGHQHKGIARKLVSKALGRGEIEGHHSEKVTVNSSPNAVGAYRRMGFVQTADEEIHNGIRAIPMMLDTTDWDAG